MPAERFYIATSFSDHQEVILEGQEFHHLAHVMRLEEEETAELINGLGQLANATLIRKEKKIARFLINSIHEEKEPEKKIILAQAIPRINRLDFIIEKGTELGVTHFRLFTSQQSERKLLTDHQVERLQGQVVSALKQCGRLFMPKIELRTSLENCFEENMKCYFGDLREGTPKFLDCVDLSKSLLFFVGPEAGFNQNEIQLLDQKGAKGVSLHSNILRTDTAALVALALASQ